MRKSIIYLSVFVLSVWVLGLSWAEERAHILSKEAPENIILLIGDGMGLSHITAAAISKGKLNMERMECGGFVKTYPEGETAYTDSASSATALATGHKTANGIIGLTPDGVHLQNCVEAARAGGMATGVIATSRITHATPAGFIAHVKSRDMEQKIASQIAASGADVLFGGGLDYFLPAGVGGGRRQDGRNLVEEMKSRGYLVATSYKAFLDIKPEKTTKALGLFSREAMPQASRRKPSLKEMTECALKILSRNKKGFFLMVEGSQIDWKGHGNELMPMIEEVKDFDEAVGAALDFARDNPDTLVIVTADHETGGFAIPDGNLKTGAVEGLFASGGHTCTMVPILTSGKAAGELSGIIDNTLIGKKIIEFINSRK